jgi:hypothetical protein
MLILLLLLPDYARFFNIRIEKSPVILLFVVVYTLLGYLSNGYWYNRHGCDDSEFNWIISVYDLMASINMMTAGRRW